MHIIHAKNGDTMDQFQHGQSYSTMTYLKDPYIALAADVQQNIFAYSLDLEKRKIHEMFED